MDSNDINEDVVMFNVGIFLDDVFIIWCSTPYNFNLTINFLYTFWVILPREPDSSGKYHSVHGKRVKLSKEQNLLNATKAPMPTQNSIKLQTDELLLEGSVFVYVSKSFA